MSPPLSTSREPATSILLTQGFGVHNLGITLACRTSHNTDAVLFFFCLFIACSCYPLLWISTLKRQLCIDVRMGFWHHNERCDVTLSRSALERCPVGKWWKFSLGDSSRKGQLPGKNSNVGSPTFSAICNGIRHNWHFRLMGT